MASNLFNEHIEVEHLTYALQGLITEGYNLIEYGFVAGMELVSTQ